MAVKSPVAKNAYRHTQYRLKDDTLVPGITTVTKMLNPGEGIIIAANRLGLQGIDSGVHWKNLARLGSLAHKLIEHRLKDTDPTEDLRDYTANELETARKCEAKFVAWVAQRQIKSLGPGTSEFQLVSEQYRYGGTGDWYVEVNGRLTYVDFKTGALYLEHELQGSANANSIVECRLGPGKVEQIILLGLPRNDEEEFHEKVITDWSRQWRMFLALRDAYACKQEIESVKKSANRQAAANVIPFDEVQQNAILRAAIVARGGAPA
jgi:hypothetical protein